MTADKYPYLGDFSILKLHLVDGDKVDLDISQLFLEINLFESIFDETMSGSITVTDANNLIANLILNGGEEIHFEFCTAGKENDPIKYIGVVYKISERKQNGDRNWVYSIHFCSRESITNTQKIFSKGYNTTVSNIAADLFSQVSSKNKKLYSTPTRGIVPIAVPFSRPFNAIEMLLDMAVSTEGHYGYLFYEDVKAFHFVPIQKLYQQDSEATLNLINASITIDERKKLDQNFLSIQGFNVLDPIGLQERIMNGSISGKIDTFDLATKTRSTVEYSYESLFSERKSLGKYANTKIKSAPNGYRKSQIHVSDLSGVRDEAINRCIESNVNNLCIEVSLPGNSDLYLGAIVELYVPSFEAMASEVIEDRMLSGKWLIADIRHTISRGEYMMSCTLYKDGYEVTK